MAAFSSIMQQQPFLLDSNSDPSTTTIHCNNICSLSDEPNHANYFISSLYQHQNLDHKHNPTNNDSSSSSSSSELLTVTNNKKTADASSLLTTHPKYDQNLLTTHMDNKRKSKHPSASNSPNSAQSKDKREVKGKKQKKMKDNMDEEKDKSSSKEEEEKNKAAAGYIHVRARRGQATDSHSLAERVTGKALMLDEIINYVQSLQNQVESLSMKLASVNPMFYDFGVDLEMESFMVRPQSHDDQDFSNLAAVLPSIQDSSPTTTNNHHSIPISIHLLENSAHRSVRFPQPQIPNVLPRLQQGSRGELDEHRQRIMNQSGFTNTFFSFH